MPAHGCAGERASFVDFAIGTSRTRNRALPASARFIAAETPVKLNSVPPMWEPAPTPHRRRPRLPHPRPRIGLTSIRVGFLRALNEHNARALLNPGEDDFGAVRRNVEVADHETCRQFGQLALGSGLRI
jgi:hypothetical protein